MRMFKDIGNFLSGISQQFENIDSRARGNTPLGLPFLITLDTAGICLLISFFTGIRFFMYLIIGAALASGIVLHFALDEDIRRKTEEILGWSAVSLYIAVLTALVIKFG